MERTFVWLFICFVGLTPLWIFVAAEVWDEWLWRGRYQDADGEWRDRLGRRLWGWW